MHIRRMSLLLAMSLTVLFAGCGMLGDWVAEKANSLIDDKAIPAVLNGLESLGNKLENKVDDDIAAAIKEASKDGLTQAEIMSITKQAVGTEVQDVIQNVMMKMMNGQDFASAAKEEGKNSGMDLATIMLLLGTGPLAYGIKSFGESRKEKQIMGEQARLETARKLVNEPAPITATQNTN